MAAEKTTIEWRDFLTDIPPGTRTQVRLAASVLSLMETLKIHQPDLVIYCDDGCRALVHAKCVDVKTGQFFAKDCNVEYHVFLPIEAILRYQCESCNSQTKSYAVRFYGIPDPFDGVGAADVLKIAEWPQFSPPTPSKVISLVGPDRELFLKGRRAEVEGLGIGAFSYYRRIIERQKGRLLDEIIRVAKHVGADPERTKILEIAKRETQFSKAVDMVKDAIPQQVFIKGHNPFTLLHGALSEGLHDASDEACLTAANDIRLLLLEFSERLQDVMKEKRELDAALNRILNRGNGQESSAD